MLLLQLLSLLLMLLLQLLRLSCISFLLREPLVFLVLLLLELLPLLVLLCAELFLLFLIFLVHLRIPSIGCSSALGRRKILGMDRRGRARITLLWTIRLLVTPRFCRAATSRRMVRRSSFPSRHHRVSAEFPRLFSSRDWGLALVHRSPQLWVRAGSLHMLSLSRHWGHMSLTGRRLFLRCGARLDPSVAPVVAYAVDRRVVDDRRVVNVVDVGDVHIRHCAVIKEMSIVPTSAGKTHAEVTESIIDSAVATHLRTPATLVEDKRTTTPAPPPWGPEEADLRRLAPSARHPVVIAGIVIPVPVTRSPDVTVARANGLLIYRQRRRCDRDRYSELRQSSRRHGEDYQRER